MDPAPDATALRPPWRRAHLAAAAAIFLAGLALRVAAASGEPWLDEIWSIALARAAGDAWSVLRLAHDNNHPLNTLWLLAAGDASSWIVLRLPALLLGAAALVLAARVAGERDPCAGLVALALASGSFLLVTYQSEARGYAGAVLAAYLGWHAVERWRARSDGCAIAAFGAAAWLGVFSHLTFLGAYAGLAAWSACVAARGAGSAGARLRRLAVLHAAPLAALGAIAWIHADGTIVGGGPARPILDVLASALALAFGAPESRAPGLALALALAAVLVAHVALERRAGSDAWIVAVVGGVAAPAAALLVAAPAFVAPRYFLVPFALILVAVARTAAAAIARGGAARAAAVIALALVLCGNAARIVPFLEHGRGGWSRLLADVQGASGGPIATLDGARGYDPALHLAYFGPRLPPGARVVQPARGTGVAPDWLVLVPAPDEPPPASIAERGGTYDLVRLYPRSGESGTDAALYRRRP